MYPIAYLLEEIALQELDLIGMLSVAELVAELVADSVAQSLRHGINLYQSRSHFFILYHHTVQLIR